MNPNSIKMKKTNALNLLASLILVLAFFYIVSCVKEVFEVIEKGKVLQPYLQQVEQDNFSILAATSEPIEKTKVTFHNNSFSKVEFTVSIESFIYQDRKHRSLVLP